jgi:hypothetical protein
VSRAESDLEREGLIAGAVLNAGSVERAQRVILALGTSPAALQDPVARAVLTVAVDMLSRGELPSAATVFVEGTAGSRHLFSAEDRERMRGWQASDTLTDAEAVQIGKQLHRAAQHRRLGDMLVALGTAVKLGRKKDGSAFGPSDARSWFEQIQADYNSSVASGISGRDAVLLTRASYEQRKKEGRATFTKSGFPIIDKVVGGWPHKLCWVLGPGGGGKSTFLGTQLDLHQQMGVKSVLASMEDNHEWVVTRHVAQLLGLKQREAYSGPFPDDEKAAAAEKLLFDRWQNLTILTKEHARTAADLRRLFAQYVVQDGATMFYVDNLTALDHQLEGRNDTVHAAAARSVEKFADFADRWRVTVICLAHTKAEYFERTQGRQPPELRDNADTGGGIAADRYCRLSYGVWAKKKDELRLTLNKNTAEGKLVGTTFAFDVHSDQGLLDVDSGREINIEQEKRLEREARERESQARADEKAKRNRERNKRWAEEERAKREAAKAAAEPTQAALFHVETPKERM